MLNQIKNSLLQTTFLTLFILLSGCATSYGTIKPNNNDAKKAHAVSVTETITFSSDKKKVFDMITPEDILPKVLTGYGPIPAVVATSDHKGEWGKPGAFRLVHLADGGSAKEQLTQFNRPNDFAYKVWDFDNKIIKGLATDGAYGEWAFTAVPEGTKVEWTYTFYTSSRTKTIFLSPLVKIFWRGYMKECLENYAAIHQQSTNI